MDLGKISLGFAARCSLGMAGLRSSAVGELGGRKSGRPGAKRVSSINRTGGGRPKDTQRSQILVLAPPQRGSWSKTESQAAGGAPRAAAAWV